METPESPAAGRDDHPQDHPRGETVPGVRASADAARRRPPPGGGRRVAAALAGLAAFTAVGVVVTPERSPGNAPTVDYRSRAAAAQRSASFRLAVPGRLPPGWQVTSVRFSPDVRGEEQWHVGLVGPGPSHVGVEQTNGISAEFVADLTNQGARNGSVVIDGETWQVYYRSYRQVRSLVRVRDGITTVVTGSARYPDLAAVAASLG